MVGFCHFSQLIHSEEIEANLEKVGTQAALKPSVSTNPLTTNSKPTNQKPNLNQPTKMKEMNEKELETIAGGIKDLLIGGDAGIVLDASTNDSFNTNTLTQVDASTDIFGSFNQSYSSYGGYWS